MYFDEDVVLDARLNILNDKVDKFIIIESKYTHSGKEKKPTFDLKNFQKFEKKIVYLYCEDLPNNLEQLTNEKNINDQIKVRNAVRVENYQRNYITKALLKLNCDFEDLVIISDIDEIPNLVNIDNTKLNKNLIFFNQRIFYYKFNLEDVNMKWLGSKMCKFKNLKSPQWLRNVKARKYPFWRLDTMFSNKRYTNVSIIEDGGWHFTYIKDASGIKKKLENYLHHVEYELNPLSLEDINNLIRKKKIIYDLNLDKTASNKFETGGILKTVDLASLPAYFKDNKTRLSSWLDL
jgi:beta-1,4-mannosyl-glycoprotein beta-1,4-N-acetylglucosaminyltransferase